MAEPFFFGSGRGGRSPKKYQENNPKKCPKKTNKEENVPVAIGDTERHSDRAAAAAEEEEEEEEEEEVKEEAAAAIIHHQSVHKVDIRSPPSKRTTSFSSSSSSSSGTACGPISGGFHGPWNRGTFSSSSFLSLSLSFVDFITFFSLHFFSASGTMAMRSTLRRIGLDWVCLGLTGFDWVFIEFYRV